MIYSKKKLEKSCTDLDEECIQHFLHFVCNPRVNLFFQDSANLSPLRFVCASKKKANSWRITLNNAIEYFGNLDYNKRHLIWLWDQFKYADKDNTGVLQGKEVIQFFESINLPLTKKNRDLAKSFERIVFAKCTYFHAVGRDS